MTKFKGLFEAARQRETLQALTSLNQGSSVDHRSGRPPGKRSHPDFEQITAYIRKDTHRAIKIALLQNGKQEFSELVEGLLREWLELCG
jgi:hypothetical protein